MTMQNTDAQVEVFDLGSLRSGAGGYSSAVFDGRFIYCHFLMGNFLARLRGLTLKNRLMIGAVGSFLIPKWRTKVVQVISEGNLMVDFYI